MRLAISLGVLSAANLVFLFFFQWYVLVILGPGLETDALFAGMAFPQLVLAVVGGSLTHVLVPFLAGEEEERFRKDAWGVFLALGAGFGTLSVLLYLFAPWWVPWVVAGFSPAGKALTVHLTRIQVVGVLFTALTAVLWAAYHARKKFLWAEASPLVGNAVALGAIVWALPRYGVAAAAWIMVARSFLQMVLLVPALGAYRKPEWRSSALREIWRRVKPLLAGSAYYKTDMLLDRFLASMTPAGGLSLLYLAQQGFNAANEIINKAIAAPMVPLLAEQAKSCEWRRFRAVYRRRLFWMGALTAAGYAVLAIAGIPLLTLLVAYGGVTEQNVAQLWTILLCLGGMFVGGALGQILSSAFYAKADTVTPTKIGVVTFTAGMVFKVAGFLRFGLLGIALGTSLYYLLTVAVLHFSLGRKLPRLEVSA